MSDWFGACCRGQMVQVISSPVWSVCRTLNKPVIHSFIHSFTHTPFSHSVIHSFIAPHSFIHSFIHSFRAFPQNPFKMTTKFGSIDEYASVNQSINQNFYYHTFTYMSLCNENEHCHREKGSPVGVNVATLMS